MENNKTNKILAKKTKSILSELGHNIPLGHVYELLSRLSGSNSYNEASKKNANFKSVLEENKLPVEPDLYLDVTMFRLENTGYRSTYGLKFKDEDIEIYIPANVSAGDYLIKILKKSGKRLNLLVDLDGWKNIPSKFNLNDWESIAAIINSFIPIPILALSDRMEFRIGGYKRIVKHRYRALDGQVIPLNEKFKLEK